MNRIIFLLLIIATLGACSKSFTDAKQILETRLNNPKEIEYRSVQGYPGGVVCGEYSAYSVKLGGKTKFKRFVTVRGKLYSPPNSQERELFCSDRPAEVLLNNLGVGPYDANNAELATITRDFSSLAAALESYYRDNFFYPTAAQGLEALVTEPENMQRRGNYREGGYLESIPNDPWGRPYIYYEDQWGGSKGSFKITSLGAVGAAGGGGSNADVSTDLLPYLSHIEFILEQ
jgi:general secretion pathway protein G